MSDLNALTRKLAALTAGDAVFEASGRVIFDGDDSAPVASILREVDDTILERTLSFTAGKATINIIAAGRRMRGIESVSPHRDDAMIGQVLLREEPERVQAVFELLQDLCGDAQKITVRSLPPEPFGKGGERGISAHGLADLWNIETEVVPKPPLEQFLAKNASVFSSLLHVRKGEVLSTSGDIAALQKIWSTQVQAFREAHNKTVKGEVDAQLICLDGAFDDGTSAAMALYEKDIALIAYEAEHFGTMQSSWQRIFA